MASQLWRDLLEKQGLAVEQIETREAPTADRSASCCNKKSPPIRLPLSAHSGLGGQKDAAGEGLGEQAGGFLGPLRDLARQDP